MSHRNLTSPEFWEDTYLSAYELPCRPSRHIPFDRCLQAALASDAPAARSERLIELGCAPGRWMVFYAERFGVTVEGVEYTAGGAGQTRENLRLCGLEGTIHEEDFWSFKPDDTYEMVLSLGFIEHFDDTPLAFHRHADLVAPGGRLVLGVPNFQGVNRLLQRWCDPQWLARHHMGAMGHRIFEDLADRESMRVDSVRYLGGFDPDVISTRGRGRKLLAPWWHLRRRFGDNVNAWWLSSYLLIVFSRSQEPGHRGRADPAH